MNPFGFALGLVLAYCAWAALALAMDRHYADIHGRGAEPSPRLRRRMRYLGSLGLLLAFAVAVAMQGWTIGPVGWLGFLMLAGVLQVLGLSYWPTRVPLLARCLAWVAPVLAALWLLGVAGPIAAT